jgi:uncharacterized membrane protein
MGSVKKRRKKQSVTTRIRTILRRRMLAGVLVIVPLGITAFVLHFLYGFTAGRLTPVVKRLFDPMPEYAVPVASMTILFLAVYLVGLIASVVVGRRIIGLFEGLLVRIPLVRTVYGASKQMVQTLSFQGEGKHFKSVVFIDFPRAGMKSLAFVTGRVLLEDADTGTTTEYLKVFVPTTPNPTSGYFELVPPDAVTESGITVEEAATFVMSGGFVAPASLKGPSGTLSLGVSGSGRGDEPPC